MHCSRSMPMPKSILEFRLQVRDQGRIRVLIWCWVHKKRKWRDKWRTTSSTWQRTVSMRMSQSIRNYWTCILSNRSFLVKKMWCFTWEGRRLSRRRGFRSLRNIWMHWIRTTKRHSVQWTYTSSSIRRWPSSWRTSLRGTMRYWVRRRKKRKSRNKGKRSSRCKSLCMKDWRSWMNGLFALKTTFRWGKLQKRIPYM